MMDEEKDPFQLELNGKPAYTAIWNRVRPSAEYLLGMRALRRIHSDAQMNSASNFFDAVLAAMQVNYYISEADLARIPRQGTVVVVANHPYGGVEGVILGSLLRKVRPDVKLMANFLLGRIPEFQDDFIFVDPFGTSEAQASNALPLRQTLAWLNEEHMLGVFPAGEVSHFKPKHNGVTDPGWSQTIARIVRKTKATVIPIFFDGHNSMFFQAAGLVHPRLRTAMLPREFSNKTGRQFVVRAGNAIPWKVLSEFEDDTQMIDYLRKRTYLLAGREDKRVFAENDILAQHPDYAPVVDAVPGHCLVNELSQLPEHALLLSSGEFDVYCTEASAIPAILMEIGRLREITFRLTNEGTGKAIDLDRFDEDYLHLFVWNKEKQELVGAYRLGCSDHILEKRGVKGLYTHTLFRFDERLIRKIGPALEMGRSFIRPEYQKTFAPLMLLWKGIGTFVARNPHYAVLFGPVSISNDYQTVSRQLMVTFLNLHNFKNDLAQFIRARRPFSSDRVKGLSRTETAGMVRNLDDVERLVAELEADRKGIPVLLKQYLKLGGKLLGFNVDPDFSNVLDGLIMVDLRQTPPTMLNRYLGADGSKAFQEFWAEKMSVKG